MSTYIFSNISEQNWTVKCINTIANEKDQLLIYRITMRIILKGNQRILTGHIQPFSPGFDFPVLP